MVFYSTGLLILIFGSFVILTIRKSSSVHRVAAILTLTSGICIGIAAIMALAGSFRGILYRFTWEIPIGDALFSLSPLSGFFMLIIAGISMLAAMYAPGYLKHYPYTEKRMRYHWFFFLMLVASMILVVTVQNAVLFMIAWEIMSVSSFFLVGFQNEKQESRKAGWIYLVFMHLGAACLLVMFAILGKHAGSYDFDVMKAAAGSFSGGVRTVIFILGMIGFGMKAGFFPLFAWLPEAHPTAPSHVSAVMSGVMIKTAFWGLLLIASFLGTPAPWMGWALIAEGLITGIMGIGFAAVQKNAKRLLAFSSVENVGIITIAAGIWFRGTSLGYVGLQVLGFCAFLLHILNHALFKSLMFLGTGVIQMSAETLDLDRMGGLLKRLPVTGVALVAGAAAISGLPPFNGFISEYLLYFSVFSGGSEFSLTTVFQSVAILGGLSVIGALAVFTFSKFVGTALLGEPRSENAAHAHESTIWMQLPLILLASLCLVIGLFPISVLQFLQPVLNDVGIAGSEFLAASVFPVLGRVQMVAGSLIALCVLLAVFRNRLLAGRQVTSTETWGCGFDRPDSTMQYTATSFAEPLATFAKPLYAPEIEGHVGTNLFPQPVERKISFPDLLLDRTIVPIYRWVSGFFEKFSIIQHGNTHLYVLYIVLALLVALVGSFLL